MEVSDHNKGELDLIFRYNVLNNVIMKALMKWCRKDNTNPNVQSRLKDVALCFERVTYDKATNKEDYLKMIKKILLYYKSIYVAKPAAETIDAADRKLLMRQFDYGRTVCLPILIKLQKAVVEDCAKAQSAIRRNKARHLRVRLKQMIKFLQLPESDLTHESKETLLHHLNKISEFFNSRSKLRKFSVGFQTTQFYNRHSSVTNLQRKKDFMDTMFLPMTKSTSTNANCQTSRGHPTSSKPELKKCNTYTSSVADPIAMSSQPKPLVITFDSPSTPVTLPSVAEQIVNPAKEFAATKAEGVTKVQDNSVTLGTPGASFSLPSDSSDPESNQLLIPANLPLEHIIKSVCQLVLEDIGS